jgi:hypothetical protein
MKKLNIYYEKTQDLLWKNSTFIMKKLVITRVVVVVSQWQIKTVVVIASTFFWGN